MESKDLNYCQNAYIEFVNKKEFFDLGNVVYDLLKPHIPFDKKTKQEIWEIAFWQIKSELKKEERVSEYQSLKYEDKIVITRVKQLALNKFFSMLNELSIDVKEFIKNQEQP